MKRSWCQHCGRQRCLIGHSSRKRLPQRPQLTKGCWQRWVLCFREGRQWGVYYSHSSPRDTWSPIICHLTRGGLFHIKTPSPDSFSHLACILFISIVYVPVICYNVEPFVWNNFLWSGGIGHNVWLPHLSVYICVSVFISIGNI